MTPSLPLDSLWIIGTGRLGLALGSALQDVGAVRRLEYSGRAATPPAHPLFTAGARAAIYLSGADPTPTSEAVVLAVPDAAIATVARQLSERRTPPSVALHTSGVLGSEALAPLARSGSAVGSLHPLVAVADASAAQRLRGAWFGVEGSGAALALASALVAALDGHLLPVDARGKPLYHAAAVFASNFPVALLAVAERLMGEAGVPPFEARAALGELASGAIANLAEGGPAQALTGPIARGDAETVELHLQRLSGGDRSLYSVLARATLALARRKGLDPDAAERLARLLGETP